MINATQNSVHPSTVPALPHSMFMELRDLPEEKERKLKQLRFSGEFSKREAQDLLDATSWRKGMQVEIRDQNGSRMYRAPARVAIVEENGKLLLEVVLSVNPPEKDAIDLRMDAQIKQADEEEKRKRYLSETRARELKKKQKEIQHDKKLKVDRADGRAKLQRNTDLRRLHATGVSAIELSVRFQISTARVYQILRSDRRS
jgi:Mor family transcriptional regulator